MPRLLKFALSLLAAAGLLLLPTPSPGQNVNVRYDNVVWTVAYISGQQTYVPVPGAQVQICAYPANAVPCTNLATLFVGPTVLGGTSTNPVQADQFGNFGFWAAAGYYSYTVTNPLGQSAGNNASQTTLGNLPTYGATCGPNSTPCLTFNGSSSYITPTTAIPSGLANLTFYAVVNLSSSGYNAFMGSTGNQFAEFAVNSGNNPQLGEVGISSSQSTQTTSTGTWYTLIVTYANGSTTSSFYHASAGALVPDGVNTSPGMSFPNPTNDLGASRGDPNFFNGKIAEWGYTNSVNTAGIANWSSCHYGV